MRTSTLSLSVGKHGHSYPGLETNKKKGAMMYSVLMGGLYNELRKDRVSFLELDGCFSWGVGRYIVPASRL